MRSKDEKYWIDVVLTATQCQQRNLQNLDTGSKMRDVVDICCEESEDDKYPDTQVGTTDSGPYNVLSCDCYKAI